MKDSKNTFKKVGLIGIALCAACCLLPIAAVTFGVGSLTAMSAYVESAGILTMMVAAVFFGIYYFKKSQAPTCAIDCTRKDQNSLSKVKQ